MKTLPGALQLAERKVGDAEFHFKTPLAKEGTATMNGVPFKMFSHLALAAVYSL